MVMRMCGMIAAVFLAVVLNGCSDSPTQVVEKYHAAAAKMDEKAMRKYADEPLVKLTANVYKVSVQNDKARKVWAEEMNKSKVVNEEIGGDVAIVTLKDKDGGSTVCELHKIDGKWKIVK